MEQKEKLFFWVLTANMLVGLIIGIYVILEFSAIVSRSSGTGELIGLGEEPLITYDRSTFGECGNNEDCYVSGCNHEVCRSRKEDSMPFVCIVKSSKPEPGQLGYKCGCYINTFIPEKQYGCRWIKT